MNPDPVTLLTALGLGKYAAACVTLAMCVAYVVTWIATLVPPPNASAGNLVRFVYAAINKIAGNVEQAANAASPAASPSPLAPPRAP